MDEGIALVAEFELRLPGFLLEFRLRTGPQMVVVFGPSGSGKTTALRALAGLHTPDAGVIELCGQTLFDSRLGINLPPQERKIGYVPQHYALFPHRRIGDNLAYGLHGHARPVRQRRVAEMLRLMRLEELADRFPSEVSGGEQQRAALARALVTEPKLLLMDEPFGALDEDLRVHLRDELRRVQREYGIPVVMITHNLEEAYSMADRIAVLVDGQIVQTGMRDDVFRKPATPAVARIIGMGNILEAVVVGVDGEVSVLDWCGQRLHLDRNVSLVEGQPVQLGIRPEEVMFIRQDRRVSPDLRSNLLEGIITEDRAQGFDHLVVMSIDCPHGENGRLLARIPHPVFLRLQLAVGERRRISIRPGSIHAFPTT